MRKRNPVMTVIFVVLALILILAAILVIRTFTYPFRDLSEDLQAENTRPAISELSLQRFSGGIMIPTVGNDNYDETDFGPFDRFKEYLPEVYPAIYETMDTSTVNTYGLVFRWPGRNASRKPILFLSHYDVVPVDGYNPEDYEYTGETIFRPADAESPSPEQYATGWEFPPFSGAVANGSIYGRGTLDMKCMLFAVMEAADALINEGFVPEQDIWFAFGQDEETGGRNGALKIADYFLEKGLDFDAVYDEGGIVSAPGLGGFDRSMALVGIAEKGFANIKISVRGVGGHASMPPGRSSLVQAAEIIEKLNNEQLPLRLIDPVSSFLDNVGGSMGFASRMAIANKWLLKPLLLGQMSKVPATNALVRSTTAITQAKGSDAPNVISAVSEVTVNFRILPGDSISTVVDHVRKICEGYDVVIDYERPREPSKISPSDSRGFQVVEESMARLYPGSIVSSYITIGGTDAYKYEIVSDHVYRFLPMYLNAYEQQTIHNDNEHITIANFSRMIAHFRYIMENF